MKVRMRTALAAAAALVLSAGGALAAPATATTNLNVRSGPGTGYAVIGTIPAGRSVEVIGCDGPWCEVDLGARSGFASASYLSRAVRERVIVEEIEEPTYGLSIGGYWDDRPWYFSDGYYYWGGRWWGVRPGRPGWHGSHRPRPPHWGRPGRPGWDRPG
ncbi:SH3 domain-containing protein, partial [Methylopila musalis]